MTAPTPTAGICQRSRTHCPASSRRYPQTPETFPSTRPIPLEIVATTGSKPNARSVGKVISVPEPATTLIAPAPKAASAMKTISWTGTATSVRALAGSVG